MAQKKTLTLAQEWIRVARKAILQDQPDRALIHLQVAHVVLQRELTTNKEAQAAYDTAHAAHTPVGFAPREI